MTATAPATVRRFAWYTDRGQQTFRFDKFMDTAGRMMVRRHMVPSAAYVAALKTLHESTWGKK